jgi:putative hydrolase of the HAD superfamily
MIFFDIDGTLIDHVSASAAASLALFDHCAGEIPFSREDFPVNWERILNKHFNRFCRGEISLWEQRRARIREAFGAPEMPQDEADARYRIFIREYESLTRPFEDAAPCLEGLAGRQLGIISNGAREQQIGKLKRAGLLHHFSVMVYAEDVGLGKPASSIFLEACRRADCPPEACAYIGDDPDFDVVPSRALGMRGIHLDRAGSSAAATLVISTLSNLAAVLQ